MVRIDDRLNEIRVRYVDRGSYFVINRGRQYGKTTTLMALADFLENDYAVIFMDFQEMSTDSFRNGQVFVISFIEYLEEIFGDNDVLMENIDAEVFQKIISLKSEANITMDKLFRGLSRMCKSSKKPMVLIIDEVDSASNNQVFVDFLAQLRSYYLKRSKKSIFHSVILAGVYDIKNLKLKIRLDTEHQYNSPWNIAAEFNIDMSLSVEQIASMLQEYEADNHMGIDINAAAQYIFDFTSGYPYLVSAVCKLLDEEIPQMESFKSAGSAWTKAGIDMALKILLGKHTSLFASMTRQMSEFPELKRMLKAIVFQGKKISYNLNTHEINLAAMFGYIKDSNGSMQIANRIFETLLCNLFLSEEELTEAIYDKAQGNTAQFIQKGRLDMDLVFTKFVEYFTEIYGRNTEKFIEKNGRRLFLLFLKPIINGTGNYYIESQTRDAGRTDVIVDYLGEQFIIEMKIWHGNEYNERGEEQLAGYLDYYHKDKGYLLSFNFNKKKETGVKTITLGNRTIVEAVV